MTRSGSDAGNDFRGKAGGCSDIDAGTPGTCFYTRVICIFLFYFLNRLAGFPAGLFQVYKIVWHHPAGKLSRKRSRLRNTEYDSPLRGRLKSDGEGKISCVWHPREGGAVKLHPAAGAFPCSWEKTEKHNPGAESRAAGRTTSRVGQKQRANADNHREFIWTDIENAPAGKRR